MNKFIDKIEFDGFVLFLYECPTCGTRRQMDGEKIALSGGVTALGILGIPYFGMLGFIATIKAIAVGTLTMQMGLKYMQLNGKFVKYLNEKKLFSCPKCQSTKLVISKDGSPDGIIQRGKCAIQNFNDDIEKKLMEFDIDGNMEKIQSKIDEYDRKYAISSKYDKTKKIFGNYLSKIDNYFDDKSK